LPIRAPRWPFTPYLVADAPEMPGVFALWEKDEVVYIGRATAPGSIRRALLERLNGEQPSTASVSHYAWEICLEPEPRELELLDEHKRAYRVLPRYNRQET
jgi:hypothetical protein